MIYRVELTPTAEAELMASFWYIHERAPLNAIRWLKGIYKAVDSLEAFPHRCATAPEAQFVDPSIRHFLFKSHRIIFVIDEVKLVVRILYVRHAAQRAIGEPETD